MNRQGSATAKLNLWHCWIAGILLTSTIPCRSADPPDEIQSPTGKYTVEIRGDIGPRVPGHDLDLTLALLQRGRIMTGVSTIGYLLGCYWTQDERYVAVNNRRANSGDYVWVFSLQTGKVVKRPDDLDAEGRQLDYDGPTRAVIERVTAKLPEFTWHTFLRRTTMAKGWQSPTELRVDTRILFSHSEGTWVLLSEVYQVGENKFQLRESKVSKQRSAD